MRGFPATASATTGCAVSRTRSTYNLGNFRSTLALPDGVGHWSPITLRARAARVIKVGAKIVRHGRFITFQMAEIAIPGTLFVEILRLIDGLRPAHLRP